MSDNSYNNWYFMNDAAISTLLGKFIRQQRINQNKTQAQVSHDAGISRSTLSLLERGETVTLATFIQVLRVLNQLHVFDAFVPQVIESPMVMAKMEKYARKRARTKKVDETPETDW